MRVLVIGGGIFVGRSVVAAAQERGHAVAVFNRGRSGPAPDGVEAIRGDRDADLAALKGRTWDAIIDTCAYFPRQVRTLLAAVGESSAHYTLVSTIMVYRNLQGSGTNEEAEVHLAPGPEIDTVTPATYGPLKAGCEQAAAGFRHRLVVRPGIIVGPDDPTGRFTYWVRRGAGGGEMLAPGAPTAPLQLIDARDLAEWLVARVEDRASGVFNAVGSPELTWGEMIRTVVEAAPLPIRVTWVDGEFLAARKADDWAQLPLFIPASNRDLGGIFRIGGHAARRAGLRLRPLRETVSALRAWLPSDAAAKTRQPGLTPEAEAALLAAWGGAQQR